MDENPNEFLQIYFGFFFRKQQTFLTVGLGHSLQLILLLDGVRVG